MAVRVTSSILAFAALTLASSISFTDKGRALDIDGIPCYVGGTPQGKLDGGSTSKAVDAAALINEIDLFPLTVVESSAECFGPDELLGVVSHYQREDDVFTPAFLRTVYLQSIGGVEEDVTQVNVTSLEDILGDLDVKLFITPGEILRQSLPVTSDTINGTSGGPYFFSAATGNIYKAHRLYSDHNLAFTQGVVSDE